MWLTAIYGPVMKLQGAELENGQRYSLGAFTLEKEKQH